MKISKKILIPFAMSVLYLTACTDDLKQTDSKQNSQDQTSVQKHHFKMASTYPGSLIMLGTMGKRIEKDIAEISGGNLTFKFFEPGALVPALEIFDAVAYGALDSGWATPGYWAGKHPALQLFGAVPFGPDAPEYTAWFFHGGGKEIFEEIYHKENIHSLICGMSPPEASGWFRKEIKTLDDLKGLKMRFFGLGSRVMSKLGVSTQLMATGDIFTSLELGTIDATEFSVPAVDLKLGLHKLAKHYYFPGWHQQSTFFELMINLDKWKLLSPMQQKQLETVCRSNMLFGISSGEAAQADAIKEMKSQGVIFHTWSAEFLSAFKASWTEVAAEESAKDPDFKRAWESLKKFRKNYKPWKDLGYLK